MYQQYFPLLTKFWREPKRTQCVKGRTVQQYEGEGHLQTFTSEVVEQQLFRGLREHGKRKNTGGRETHNGTDSAIVEKKIMTLSLSSSTRATTREPPNGSRPLLWAHHSVAMKTLNVCLLFHSVPQFV
jgi:hypothetical protein